MYLNVMLVRSGNINQAMMEERGR